MARPTLYTHPKFRRLIHLLGMPEAHVLGHLEFLWHVAYQSGQPLVGDATDVELAAGWVGTPGVLAAALIQVRFLDETPAGLAVHNLHQNAPEYVTSRFRRECERSKVKTCQGCGEAYHSSDRRSRYCCDACKSFGYRQKVQHRDTNDTDRHGDVGVATPTTPTDTDRHGTPAPAPAPAPKILTEDPDHSEDPSESVRSGRARASAPVWRPASLGPSQGAASAGLVDGRDQRLHGQHLGFGCDRDLCVCRTIHAKLSRRLGTPDADARLRAWYPTVLAKYAGQTVGDDRFDFWQNEFAAWVGVVTSKPTKARDTLGLHNAKEAAAALAHQRPSRPDITIARPPALKARGE